ncbi:MAG: TraB/GumN family protein [Candidatus Kapaibacteriales bacterium]
MKAGFFKFLFLFTFFHNLNIFSKGFFWEAENETSKIYLFGSIHISKKATYPLDSIVESKFTNCGNLVVEMNLVNVDPVKLAVKTKFADTTTLYASLPKQYIPFFDSTFKVFNIPKFLYKKFKPWFAMLTLMNLELTKNSNDAEIGIDMYFLKRVDTTKKVIELESFDEQADFLETIYNEYPEEFLSYFTNEINKTRQNFDTLFNAWVNGDYDLILNLTNVINAESKFEKSFVDLFINRRNEAMAEKLEKLSRENNCLFVVVGAGHLVGDDGIVNLLRKRGFKVKRLV